MTEDDSFCLRWSNHKATVMTVFDSLLKSQTLVDVTLASEGRWLRAHRLVLSACSKYFEELLTFQPEKNAILYLKDVPFSHLEALIAFMYRGEVNVSQTELPNFIKTADSLRIRGLSDSSRLQELASQAAELPADTSLSGAKPPSQSAEDTLNKSSASPNRSSTPVVRRSKRLRSESPHEAVVPNVRKSGLQEKRVPVVQLAPIDAVVSGDRNESTASSHPRSTPSTARSGIESSAPTSNSQPPMVVIPSSAEEDSTSVEDALCSVMVPKVEMEDGDPEDEALDNTGVGGEEEWSDMEGQGTAQDETEGWQTQEANNSGAVNGEEEPRSENRFRNQGNETSGLNLNSGNSGGTTLQCGDAVNLSSTDSVPKSTVHICSTCQLSFSRKFNLKRHLRNVHKVNQNQ